MKPVIRTLEDAKAHDPRRVALVEVPGTQVPMVFHVVRTVETPRNYKQKKAMKSLLGAVAKLHRM